MPLQLLFVQGGGDDTHDTWDSRLVSSLQASLGASAEVRYPRMPSEADPEYSAWTSALAQELAMLRDGAILVGHSIGGTLLLRTLAELQSSRRFGAIITLAAPFVGEGGWQSDDVPPTPDFARVLSDAVPVHLFHGLGDDIVPPEHLDLYATAIPWARTHPLPGRDHQFNEDLSEVAAVVMQRP